MLRRVVSGHLPAVAEHATGIGRGKIPQKRRRGNIPALQLTALGLGLALLAGCATSIKPAPAKDPALEQRMRQTLRAATPRPARVVQRGVVTAAGRQFSCDGLAQLAADGGLRLALLTPMGVITELRIAPDGMAEIIKAAPTFRESWAREHVAATAQLLFPRQIDVLTARGATLSDGARTYRFSADGGQWLGAEADGVVATRTATGWHVKSASFELELRTVK